MNNKFTIIQALSYWCILAFSLFSYTANSQQDGYEYTIQHNDGYNFTIGIVPNYDSGTFQPYFSDYTVTLRVPAGNTIELTQVHYGMQTYTGETIQGAAIITPDLAYNDYAYHPILVLAPVVYFGPHEIGEFIPVAEITITSEPTTGIMSIVEFSDPVNDHINISGGFQPAINVDVSDDGIPNIGPSLIDDPSIPNFTSFNFETLNTPTPIDVTGFDLYPNPMDTDQNFFHYVLPNGVQQLDLNLYDLSGRLVKTWKDLPVQHGKNTLERPTDISGMYLMEFSFNNGAQKINRKFVVE